MELGDGDGGVRVNNISQDAIATGIFGTALGVSVDISEQPPPNRRLARRALWHQMLSITNARWRDCMPKMRQKADLPEKTCEACGRPFVWRKKWAKVWDEVKTCSERCKLELRRKRREA